MFALFIALPATLSFWPWLFIPLFYLVPQGWWLALAIIYVGGGIAAFILLLLGLMDLFDFLTLPLQARVAKQAGILELKDVQMGRFRHILKATVLREFVPMEHQQNEVVLTVAATRRGLKNVLRAFGTAKPSPAAGARHAL